MTSAQYEAFSYYMERDLKAQAKALEKARSRARRRR